METLHELDPRRKVELSTSFMDEVPKIIRIIEQEWGHQETVGDCSFRNQVWLQQAHGALCTLAEFREEAS